MSRSVCPVRWLRTLCLLFGFVAGLPGLRAAAGYEYFVTGDPTQSAPRPTEPGLMLMGGSDNVDEAFRWLIHKAGGGRLVILRASGDDNYHDYFFKEIGGVISVETLVFHDRTTSADPRVLEILRHADGIFIAGGDQSNYVKFWQGTPVNAALDDHVRAGKPIGGTSAGLAILGAYTYGCMDSISLLPADALRDPFGPSVTLIRDFLHLPYLGDVITDSHFTARGRLGRLVPFVARLTVEEKKPIHGLGVDEKTALCIEPDGTARVFTQAHGKVWLVLPPAAVKTLTPGKPLVVDDVSIVVLDPQSRLDLKTFSVERPSERLLAATADGLLKVQPQP
jgi:beta-aspartyl-peptidase (threonine type)